jgi:hypothetical protein
MLLGINILKNNFHNTIKINFKEVVDNFAISKGMFFMDIDLSNKNNNFFNVELILKILMVRINNSLNKNPKLNLLNNIKYPIDEFINKYLDIN